MQDERENQTLILEFTSALRGKEARVRSGLWKSAVQMYVGNPKGNIWAVFGSNFIHRQRRVVFMVYFAFLQDGPGSGVHTTVHTRKSFCSMFIDAWADARMKYPTDKATGFKKPPLLLVTGRQFEWRMQYAGADKVIGTPDDIHLVNDLHIPVNEEIVIQIQTEDVLHSFFLPNMRIKQDVVPGMRQHIWFEAKNTGTYDIVCAELCGWGHYKMRGRLIVQTEDDFKEWMASAIAEQNKTSLNANE